tara:strand:- start:3060 stop:3359 length:300 start_codon:yes stop_codon:yes gene_type:complete
MFVASHDNRVYTKAVISRELFITRQAAGKMVEECLAEKWIEEDGKGYKGTAVLIKQFYNYTEFHVETVKNKPLRYWMNAMENYEMASSRKVSTDVTIGG